jgi:hypothetical protein
MTNRGGELRLPAMPQCYLESWQRIVWPKVLKKHGGDNLKGSVLDKKVTTTSTELERIKLYGPAWSWMALPPWARDAYWSP